MYEKEFGKIYNRLTIIGDGEKKGYVECKCICGNIKEIRMNLIKGEYSKSCGCLQKETAIIWRTKYDQTVIKNLLYVYKSIITRCGNKNSKAYKNYGGRGIQCERKHFQDFYNDMYSTYKKGLTIERIDNDGNYEKSNCKWIPKSEQSKNRRYVKKILYNGKYYIIPELAKISGLGVEMIRWRINRGRDINDVLHIKNKYKGTTTLLKN